MRTLLRQAKDKSPVQPTPGGFRLKRTPRQRRSRVMDGPPLIVLRESRGEAISSVAETAEPPSAQSSGSDALQLYLREIGQVKLITPEEEIALWRRIKRGDETAREEMIKANLRLVVKIARDYENLGLPLLDLISEGNMGLMKGVDRFDPRKGAKLSTYSAWWIKQTIKRALANQSRTIRLPVHAGDKMAAIRRADMKMREILGRAPTDEEVADEVGMSSGGLVRQYRNAAKTPLDLDGTIGSGPDSDLVADVIADSNAAAPFERLKRTNDTSLMNEAFTSLDNRESSILMMRFGLEDKKPKTLEEIGAKFGITRERIRQIQEKALEKLRKTMECLDCPPRQNGNDQGIPSICT